MGGRVYGINPWSTHTDLIAVGCGRSNPGAFGIGLEARGSGALRPTPNRLRTDAGECELVKAVSPFLTRGFQGFCLTYTVKGPQFEETNTQL